MGSAMVGGAAAVFLARTGGDKEQIRDHVERKFGYPLDRPIDDIPE
jgi:hypothetical protein